MKSDKKIDGELSGKEPWDQQELDEYIWLTRGINQEPDPWERGYFDCGDCQRGTRWLRVFRGGRLIRVFERCHTCNGWGFLKAELEPSPHAVRMSPLGGNETN